MPLDATPKSPTANAFCTVEEADTFLTTGRLYIDAWLLASADDKARAVVWATSLLDQAFTWFGYRRTREQALRWPRGGVADEDNEAYDYDTNPLPLKRATAELAFELLTKNRTAEPELLGQGFSKATAGPVSVTVDAGMVLSIIPKGVILLLRTLGTLASDADDDGNDFQVIPLERA